MDGESSQASLRLASFPQSPTLLSPNPSRLRGGGRLGAHSPCLAAEGCRIAQDTGSQGPLTVPKGHLPGSPALLCPNALLTQLCSRTFSESVSLSPRAKKTPSSWSPGSTGRRFPGCRSACQLHSLPPAPAAHDLNQPQHRVQPGKASSQPTSPPLPTEKDQRERRAS